MSIYIYSIGPAVALLLYTHTGPAVRIYAQAGSGIALRDSPDRNTVLDPVGESPHREAASGSAVGFEQIPWPL